MFPFLYGAIPHAFLSAALRLYTMEKQKNMNWKSYPTKRAKRTKKRCFEIPPHGHGESCTSVGNLNLNKSVLSAKPLLLHPLTCRIKPCGTVRNVNPGWINRIQRSDCTQRLGKTVALNINRQHSATRTPIKTRGLIKGHQIYQSFTTVFPEWGSYMNHGGLLRVSLVERVIGRFLHLISHDEFKCHPTHLDTSDVHNYGYMIHTPLNPICPLFCRFEPQVLPKENWVVLWVSGIYIYIIYKYPPHTKIHLQDFTTIK